VKIHHILKAAEFKDILHKGKKIHGKTVSFYVSPEENSQPLSVGVIISKKQAALAVRRNHIKRLIYAHFRGLGEIALRGRKVIVRLVENVNEQSAREVSLKVREELRALTGKVR